MKSISQLLSAAALGVCCATIATSAHAIRIDIQDKGVRGGQYVEHYEGRCSGKHSGEKWVVRFVGGAGRGSGWTFSGPEGSGKEEFRRVDWESKAREMCGESRGGGFRLG